MRKQTKDTKAVESIYIRIREILDTARSSAYRAVNFAMVQAYWNIGMVIVEDEQMGRKKAEYGEFLLKELSVRLTREFGKGFDPSNLRYMRLFYLSFEIMNSVRLQSSSREICDAVRHISLPTLKGHAPLRDELPVVQEAISWTHYRLLLKVERPEVRNFYMQECITANWSTRQLERQINSFYYERLLSSKSKKRVRAEIKRLEPSAEPHDVIKDPYVLEFLGLKENREYLETSLEQGSWTSFMISFLNSAKVFHLLPVRKG